MRLALCNEVLAPWPFARQCEWAAALGYQGLELAPFTLGEAAWRLPASERAALRRAASDAGIRVSGLHWLLRQPEGLSITSPEAAVRARTLQVLRGLVDLCAELGGEVLVHGSPAQRRLTPGDEAGARERAAETFATVAEHAQAAGVTYCIEPLAPPEADFIHTLAEAAALVRAIDRPALRTMLDCCAAARAEAEPVHGLLARWLPSGLLAHVQVNDPNGRGPGQGALGFAGILRALRRHGYAGWLAVEPFDHHPDGPAAAARAIGYLCGLLEALD